MTVQIVEIAGQKMAVLPVADYERLIDAAEERSEDRRDTAAAIESERRRADGEAYLPSNAVDRIMNGESALKVWRQHAGLTQVQLGDRVKHGSGYISRLESGQIAGSPRVWQSLAKALGVTTDDILPVA